MSGLASGPSILRIRIQGSDIGGAVNINTRAIITGATRVSQGNYVIVPSLDDIHYVYSFGNKMDELAVTGIALPGLCNLRGGGEIGVDQVVRNYEALKLSTRGAPVLVSIGNTQVLRAILGGMRLEIADPTTGLAQWSYIFQALSPGSGRRQNGKSDTTNTLPPPPAGGGATSGSLGGGTGGTIGPGGNAIGPPPTAGGETVILGIPSTVGFTTPSSVGTGTGLTFDGTVFGD
jgi:hypothetical protein